MLVLRLSDLSYRPVLVFGAQVIAGDLAADKVGNITQHLRLFAPVILGLHRLAQSRVIQLRGTLLWSPERRFAPRVHIIEEVPLVSEGEAEIGADRDRMPHQRHALFVVFIDYLQHGAEYLRSVVDGRHGIENQRFVTRLSQPPAEIHIPSRTFDTFVDSA